MASKVLPRCLGHCLCEVLRSGQSLVMSHRRESTCWRNGTGRRHRMPASDDDARKMLPSAARDAAAMAMPASGSRCDSWCPDDCCDDRTC